MIRDSAGTDSRPELMAAERVECTAWLDWYSATPPGVAERLGVRAADHGAMTLLAVRDVPSAAFNRAVGLGIRQPVTEAALDKATAWLQAHASPAWVLQVSPAAPDTMLPWLEQRHFRPSGAGWSKFQRGPRHIPAHPVATGIEIRPVEPRDAATFGAVLQAGFELPLPFAAWFAALVGRPGWRPYLAYDGGAPVAAGALFLDAGWGWLGMDATLPACRGRGAQTALLSRRVADGIAAGVTGFSAETAQPPMGQEAAYPSYRNFRRAGFTTAYIRAHYRAM
jgi:hypothetical protein